MSTVGDILSTMGVFSAVGRYLEYFETRLDLEYTSLALKMFEICLNFRKISESNFFDTVDFLLLYTKVPLQIQSENHMKKSIRNTELG